MDDYDLSYEPMEVDMSSHSANEMEISYTGCTENKTPSCIDLSIVKSERLETDDIIVENTESLLNFNPNKLLLSNMQNSYHILSTKMFLKHQYILLSLTFLVMSFFIYQLANFTCIEGLNIDIIRHNLKTKLYGQEIAGESIINALESEENRKLLVFYGGTGVGKTYSTSLMLENILNHKNIYHYIMPSFLETFSSDLMLGLLFCKSAILVVDDLKQYNTVDIKPVINELILKSEKLSKNITIILVYNCVIVSEDLLSNCDDSFHSELKQSLKDVKIKKYFIKFKSLTQEHLRNCIKDEVGDKKLSAKDIDMLVKNFDVTLDGCKGVHQKLQYKNIL